MRARCVVAAILCFLLLPWLPARADGAIQNRKVLVQGVSVFRYLPSSISQPNAVNVLAINPGAAAKLKVVAAPPSAPGGRLPTSQLCRITPRCIAAVNGGFFLGQGKPVPGQEPANLSTLLQPAENLISNSLQVLLGTKQTTRMGHDSFTLNRHPRTIAFGNGQGKKWFVTVDGRQGGYSQGIRLEESLALAKSLGATWAVNLDGGCSTTLVASGKVMNRPCQDGKTIQGGIERPVANAIVVIANPVKTKPVATVPVQKPTSEVRVLGISKKINAAPKAPSKAESPSSTNRPLRGIAITLFGCAVLLAASQNERPAGKHSSRSSI